MKPYKVFFFEISWLFESILDEMQRLLMFLTKFFLASHVCAVLCTCNYLLMKSCLCLKRLAVTKVILQCFLHFRVLSMLC